MSTLPLTCGPSADFAPLTAASARVSRACATFRVGLPAIACSTRFVSVVSPKPRHQSAATGGIAGALVSMPTLVGATIFASDEMPALLAQPLSVSTMLDASATAIPAIVGSAAGNAARTWRTPLFSVFKASSTTPSSMDSCCGFICLGNYLGEARGMMATGLSARVAHRVAGGQHALQIGPERQPFGFRKAGEVGVHHIGQHGGNFANRGLAFGREFDLHDAAVFGR